MTRRPLKYETALVVGALLVLASSLIYFRTISTYRAPYRLITDLPIPAWIEDWYGYRWFARGALAAAVVALAAVELFGAGVTRRLGRLLRGRWSPLALVAALTLAGRSYLLTPGRLILGDAIANVANAMAIKAAVEQGNWPPFYWSNFAHMGFPWLQFHNSLFYYQGALVAFVVGDAYLASKLVLLINLFLAAVAIFYYVRFLSRSAWAALVSATVWSTTFFHYHFFVHVGSIHISTLLPFIPASLLCVEAILARRHTRQAVAGLALSVCVMAWAHAFYAAVTVALIGLYVLTRLLVLRWPRWRARLPLLLAVGSGVALGLIGAASQWLPVYLERNLVGGWTAGSRFSHPLIDWRQVLTFRDSFLTPDWWGGYVGLSVFALAVLGVVLALVLRDARAFGLIVWLAATAYLSLGPRYLPFDPIISRLPFGELVYAIRTPGKYLLWAEFGLAALAGVAVREAWLAVRLLRRKLAGRRWPLALAGRRFALLASVAVAAEMIFFSLQVNSLYPETWAGASPGYAEALAWVSDHGDRTSRLLNANLGDLETPTLSRQPSFNSHNEESLPSKEMFWYLLEAVNTDMLSGNLRPETRDGMYLLDVGYVAAQADAPADESLAARFQSEPFHVWQVRTHSPIVAAPLAEQADASSYADLIRMMEVDRQTNTARLIPLSDGPPVEAAPEGEGGALRLIVSRYEVELTRVRLDYEVSQPAVLQLSYSAYPYLRLYLDGRPTEYFATAFGLIGVVSPAGKHSLELRPELSPLRVATYWLDALGVLGVGVVAAWRMRPRRL